MIHPVSRLVIACSVLPTEKTAVVFVMDVEDGYDDGHAGVTKTIAMAWTNVHIMTWTIKYR
jgi:hypothetical protein